jgi:hypothetical protein
MHNLLSISTVSAPTQTPHPKRHISNQKINQEHHPDPVQQNDSTHPISKPVKAQIMSIQSILLNHLHTTQTGQVPTERDDDPIQVETVGELHDEDSDSGGKSRVYRECHTE